MYQSLKEEQIPILCLSSGTKNILNHLLNKEHFLYIL